MPTPTPGTFASVRRLGGHDPRICPCCGQLAERLFRCKHAPGLHAGAGWHACCAICLARLGQDNPHFVYGGMLRWRPHYLVRPRDGHRPPERQTPPARPVA